MIDFRDLVKAGVHFGHQSSRWCPRMAPYIWGQKNRVHLINVAKTAYQLEKAAKFLEGIVAEGKTVMWIGTKKPAQTIVKEAACSLSMPYVTHRWIGGTLTNNSQVKKSVTKFLHLKDVIEKSDRNHYTKKEFNVFQKNVDRLEKNIGGIVKLNWPVGAVVAVDVRKEASAIKEAICMGIPVVGLIDTNSDPLGINYVIPGNDDSPKSIKILIDYLVEAAQRGVESAKNKKIEDEKEFDILQEKKKAERREVAAKRAADIKEAAAKKVAAAKPVAKAAPKKVEAKVADKPAAKAATEVAPKKEEPKATPKKEAAPKK
jgi:small subunit ribosomal protein S2